METDTRFFTNEDNNSLLERFKATLPFTRFFDVLVGYFRSSGFGLLADALDTVEKIRILVGLETEREVLEADHAGRSVMGEASFSHAEIRTEYSRNVQEELETAPETRAIEDSIRKFVEFIRAGKIEIRGHPSRDIHAKVYISRYYRGEGNELGNKHTDFGNVVTGSSNFTNSGLVARREFNVQLKADSDVRFALDRFEKLWTEAVELTEEFINTATKKTWLNDCITPYELYLKFLYEYFKEDINLGDGISAILPDGFHDLEYQRQAVIAARKVLDLHNGVFLADVVGLGKTFIASMLLQNLPGQKLIICPPVLKPYWEETLRTFYIHPARVVSSGKLADITDSAKYSYIVVDESHRFRNEKTQSYELLKKICLGKKVVLLSATPLNNRLDDLLAQLKLFQKGRDSTIPGVANLEGFFRQQIKAMAKLDPALAADKEQIERISAQVRDKVLKHVMIRRTRKEVNKYFGADIAKNGLTFPEVENPAALVYEFDADLDDAFNQTVFLLRNLTYARYAPLLYQISGVSQIEALSQKNIKGFIKTLLVKRLESSFHAFAQSIERFIYSYEAFIEAFNNGKVYVGRQVDIGELLDSDDLEEMEARLSRKGVEIYDAADFDERLLTDLKKDLSIFQKIASIWVNIDQDPKYATFLQSLKTNTDLINERILVFTESRETGEYLYGRLQEDLPGEAAMFSSNNALYNGQSKSAASARELIRSNFDPASGNRGEDFRILITTDVLAEGMNLHRAGRIMNYDLPWNPTRVMQRLGRVNRVGTEHKKICIFNFFPTAQADSHLGLQENITKKITAFNSVLGNDNKILFEDEIPDPHGLFRRLATIGEEPEEDSELEYLQQIREIRDSNPKLFEKIKHLPLKARSGYSSFSNPDELVIFLRDGYLKKFIACGQDVRELTFLEAASLMTVEPGTKRAKLPLDYYSRLQRAREFLEGKLLLETEPPRISAQYRHLLLSISYLQKSSSFTDQDQEYLGELYKAVSQSALAKKTIKRLADTAKLKHANAVALFNALLAVMPIKELMALQKADETSPKKDYKPKQIVLCQYIAPINEAHHDKPAISR